MNLSLYTRVVVVDSHGDYFNEGWIDGRTFSDKPQYDVRLSSGGRLRNVPGSNIKLHQEAAYVD